MPTIEPAPRILRRRSRRDWLVISAAAVIVVIAMVQLAAGPIYSDAVTLGALHRTVDEAPRDDVSIRVELRTTPEGYTDADAAVVSAARQAFPDGTATTRDIESITYALPEQRSADRTDLAVFRYLEDVELHATLAAGTWPTPGAEPHQAAVASRVADMLGLAVGTELELASQREDTTVRIEIVGRYDIDDPGDPYWTDDLLREGVVDSNSFRTIGPFVVSRDDMLSGLTSRALAVWWVEPDLDQLTVAGSDGFRSQVQGFPARLDTELATAASGRLDSFSEFDVATGLDDLLAGTSRSLTVTRSGVLAVVTQLTLLAVYALVLTAGLMVETRRRESDLFGARGASPGQLVTVSTTEALALAVPAALVAPWLAMSAVAAMESVGPLAEIDIDLDPRVTGLAVASLTMAVAVVVALLSWPALRTARRQSSTGSRQRRPRLRALTQRTGVDLALVLLCILAFWQLSELGPDQAATIQGRFSVDPLLIISPALGLVAGAVLALRVVPLLARGAERAVVSGRSLVPALAGWQVARRPTRHARSALLLIMAVTIGFLAAAYTASWERSQEDQATHQVGSDLRVTPNRRTGDSITDLHLTNTHESIDGVLSSMPVVRRGGPLVGSDIPAEFMILDAARAAATVQIRDDLATDFSGLMATLSAGRPELAGVELPGEPALIRLEATATELEIETADGDVSPVGFDAGVRLVIQDGNQMLHRVDFGTLTANDGGQRLEAVVAGPPAIEAAYPLSMVGVELLIVAPTPPRRAATVEIGELTVVSSGGETISVPMDHTSTAWTLQTSSAGNLLTGPTIEPAPTQPEGRLRLAIDPATAAAPSPVQFGIRPTGTVLPDEFPIVVTRSWLESTRSSIGDTVRLPSLRTERDEGRIVGALESFPTVDPTRGEAILVDLPTFQAMDLELGRGIVAVGEHWLAIEGDANAIGQDLLAAPIETVDIAGRASRAAELKTDPSALGSIGALAIGFVAAAVFATVGFIVSSTVSIRERTAEFALLRALGLSSRQLGRWLATEQLVLIAVSLLLGTVLGFALSAAILPLISVTQDGAAVLPSLRVVYPWRVVIMLDLILIGSLAVVVFVTTTVLPRRELGSRLRAGDE